MLLRSLPFIYHSGQALAGGAVEEQRGHCGRAEWATSRGVVGSSNEVSAGMLETEEGNLFN